MSDSSQALLQRASALWREGRLEEAAATYRRLLEADPTQPDAWYNLGYLLKAGGRYDEALAAYDQALAHNVDRAEQVHLNRAVIFADHLRRDDQAEQELRAALAIAPDFASALLNLGNLHEERGERAEAISCYERILVSQHLTAPEIETDTDRGIRLDALARLAHLSPPDTADAPLLRQLREAADSARVSEDVRANLLFALGRAYDTLGLTDPAFRAFEQGNSSARRAAGVGYDRERSRLRTDALIAAFSSQPPVEPDSTDPIGPSPLFICGMFRSGSTLLEQILAAHPQMTPGGELELLPRLVAGPLAPFPASMAKPDPQRERALAHAYRVQLATLFPQATPGSFVSDKRPDNFLLIGLIRRLFPTAKILHTTRHPLDNGLSVFMQHLNGRVAAYANDLGDIGHYYGEYRRLMAHWKTLYGDSIFDFDYDAFVANPRPALERLLAFLGLDWDERCLQFHQLRNTVKTASYWQVRQPLYGAASGRWRSYGAHLEPLRAALRASGVDDID